MAKFTKDVVLVAPFINLKKGLVIEAKVTGRGETKMDDDKMSKYLDVELLTKLTNPPKPKDKNGAATEHKAGETMRVSIKAGNQRMYDLADGTEFQLTVLGQVPSTRGNDAWTFGLKLAE